MDPEQKNLSPYRAGVRVEPAAEPMEPLPDFLTVRYDELVTRDRVAWEKVFKPPKWWVKHVARHIDGGSYETMRHAIKPRIEPFFKSVVWTANVITLWIGVHAFTSGDQRHDPVRAATMACAILIGVGMLICCLNGFWWSVKHVGLPPASLYLTFKEVVAWLMWRKGGKRWTTDEWQSEASAARIAQFFREETLDRHHRDLCDLRARERMCRSESERAQTRIRDYERERDRLKAEDAIIRGQLVRSIAVERERADALNAKADRLAALASDGEKRLEALTRAVATYETLQKSRQQLREAKSLDADETADLQQQEIVREEHLRLRKILRQVEAVFRGAPARTTATDEDELSARIREASERTAARP